MRRPGPAWPAAIVLLLVPAAGSAGERLPNVERAHLRAGFWIGRAAEPDAVILDPAGIARINERVYRKGYRIHPCYEHDRVPGRRIHKYIRDQLKGLRRWYKYDRDNNRMRDPGFSDLMKGKINLEAIPKSIRVEYGLTVRETPVRVMPTEMLVQRRPDEPDFDVLQSSVLEAGHPVAGYHRSTDGKWVYVQTAVCRGWIRRSRAGWTYDKGRVEGFLDRSPFLVVIAKHADIFSDRLLRKKCGRMVMGARMPLVRRERKRMVVGVPQRGAGGELRFGTAYVRVGAELSEGYLEYTARNVAIQAFKLLEEPYGWGGTENQMDCSAFIMNVFATFGFALPRTSFLQVRTFGRKRFSATEAARRKRFDSLPGLATLLEFPGHIGLYLGKDRGRHYLIHSLGAYYTREGDRDVEHRVKRVVVSGLDLGAGGKKGSLFETAQAAAVVR